MSEYGKESELIAYCGVYCRLCDYYTGRIRDSAKDLLEIVKSHSEIKLFADTAKAFDFENFVKGLKWLHNDFLLVLVVAGAVEVGEPVPCVNVVSKRTLSSVTNVMIFLAKP